jgi:hypothetical protein
LVPVETSGLVEVVVTAGVGAAVCGCVDRFSGFLLKEEDDDEEFDEEEDEEDDDDDDEAEFSAKFSSSLILYFASRLKSAED